MRNNLAVMRSGADGAPELEEDLPVEGRSLGSGKRQTTNNTGAVERSATFGATSQFGKSLMIIIMIINNTRIGSG